MGYGYCAFVVADPKHPAEDISLADAQRIAVAVVAAGNERERLDAGAGH